MARPLRIEYAGARYHVMSRGDRREDIFLDDGDRAQFLTMVGRACAKTGWEVHAFCLMTNHWHAVVETPQPNLSAGMRWLLGSYTQSFNRRHGQWGHLFGGRYKAQLIDERSGSHLVQACNYVHLNPKRAGLVGPAAWLQSYRWSSYPAYLKPSLRPAWLRVDRVLGEHGLDGDTARSRREFAGRMEAICPVDLAEEHEPLRRGWKLGAEDFGDRLVDWLSVEKTEGERARNQREMDVVLAERLLQDCLQQAGWRVGDLREKRKGDPVKVEIARKLRQQTTRTRQWIAQRLHTGSTGYLSQLLKEDDDLKV
ncbi:MAG: transposase [Chthoniobacterales bacterium]